MSTLFDWRRAILDSDLVASHRLVAFVLSMHMSSAGDSCFPSLVLLVRETRTSRRTVLRALEKLERLGYLSVLRRVGTTNKYWARFPGDTPQ